jgi:FkbM family methyltransferase
MLINLDTLVTKYQVSLKGILHIGAHECEEMESYEHYLSHDQMLWIEALPNKVSFCKEKYSDVLILEAVVSDVEEPVVFHEANNGQSSSMLKLGTHALYYPHIIYVNEFQTTSKRIDNLLKENNYEKFKFNFVNLDIQGSELKALKSMESYLKTEIDYVYTEINIEHLYQNATQLDELCSYLELFGFQMVEIVITPMNWGDAFFIKQNKLFYN